MEYLPGHVLDYRTESDLAAECLADIHSVRLKEMEQYLIKPEGALEAILTECEEMFRVYEESEFGDENKKKKDSKSSKARMGKGEKNETCLPLLLLY